MRHGQHGRWLRLLYAGLPLEKRAKPEGRAIASLALDELKKAVEAGGRAAQLFDDLGAMHELLAHRDEAIAAYSKGLEIDPNHAKMRIKRGWAFESLNQHDKALADFAEAARSEPTNAEAHTALGYVRALVKLPAEAQREADLALLHGSDQYIVLHNVACIYATLSEPADRQSQANQDAAIAILRRAVELWKREGKAPSEIDLIRGEPAFQPLRARDDFRKLLGQEAASLDPIRPETRSTLVDRQPR
jgi:tetratricopeptide (TPR) repeat protein